MQEIENDARQIKTGNAVFERFSSQEQRGLTAGGRIHAEATLILGRNERTNETQDDFNEAQENQIEQYAKERGVWFNDPFTELTSKYGQYADSGQESLVWSNPDNQSVIKSQNTLQYRSLQDKLDGITLHNFLFPESTLKVLGFGRNADGDFQIVVEQPFVKEHPTKKLTAEQIGGIRIESWF